MDILLTGFRGTSSELLVKKSKYKSIILPNDKILDSRILLQEIRRQKYDYVFGFGQKPNIKDKIYLEIAAKNNNDCVITNFEYSLLKDALESENMSVKISGNAGTSFCNALYYNVLRYIIDKKSDVKMIFCHIPFYKNITYPESFFDCVLNVIERKV